MVTTIVSNVACPGCGSLCDDLEIEVENNVVTKVKNACGMGESKFLGYSTHRSKKPLIRRNGELVPASLSDAIKEAARILVGASYPILYGWSNTSCEASRVGVELAEEIGGIVDNTSTVCHGPSALSIHDVGFSTCTLGQIRHRADLVLYWGSNPWSAHPRHIERYTNFTEGRFRHSAWNKYLANLSSYRAAQRLQRATYLREETYAQEPEKKFLDERPRSLPAALFEKDRKMIVADVRKTRSAAIADYFLQVEPNKDYELFQALRALLREEDLQLESVGGVPVDVLEDLIDVLVGCEFGVLFFGVGLTMSEGKLRNIEAGISLVRDLNQYTKFTIMPMRGHYNVTGANIVSTWQTGYPFAVDMTLGYPRYNPGETSVVDILSRGESDAALIVSSDPVAHFPKDAVKNLVKKPLVVIDPGINATSLLADVVLPCAIAGIEVEGTAYRMDRVPLPLKQIVKPSRTCLPDEEILNRILTEVRRIKKRREVVEDG